MLGCFSPIVRDDVALHFFHHVSQISREHCIDGVVDASFCPESDEVDIRCKTTRSWRCCADGGCGMSSQLHRHDLPTAPDLSSKVPLCN